MEMQSTMNRSDNLYPDLLNLKKLNKQVKTDPNRTNIFSAGMWVRIFQITFHTLVPSHQQQMSAIHSASENLDAVAFLLKKPSYISAL